MGHEQLSSVLRHLRRVADFSAARELTSTQLLERYVSSHDEEAFATLVRRYGRLVRSVCRHVLRHEQDTDDAFQATFLVFASKAASIRKTTSVASWLYGVAYRTAMNAKRARMRRSEEQREFGGCSPEQPVMEAALREVQAILDEEVNALAEKYRAPFVLCCLQGKSKAEAAKELGWKEGTVSSRLAQARKELQKRLTRRGVMLSAALCAVEVSGAATTAAATTALVTSTIKAALSFAAGKGAVAGLFSTEVASLAKGVMQSMLTAKLKIATIVLLTVGFMTGAGVIAHQTLVANPPDAQRDEGPKPLPEATRQPGPNTAKQALSDLYGDPLPAGATKRIGTLRFRQGGGTINSLLVSPDGKTLVTKTFYGDRTVCAWELATGKLLHQFPGHYEDNGAVALTPDGKTVAIGHDYEIRFYDLVSGREVRQLRASEGEVQGLAFTRDGKTMASGHASKTVLLWDLASGTTVAQLSAKHNRLTLMAFTADGKTLVTGNCFDPTIRFFDVATRKERHQLTRRGTGRLYLTREFTLSPDGRLLALGAQQGPVSIWDVRTGRMVRELRGAPFIASVAFSPDGKTLASAEHNQKGSRNALVLWDVATGKRLRRLNDNPGLVWEVAFSRDGKSLIGSSGSTIRLWDVATGKECGPATGNPVEVDSVVLSPDGRTLAYRADSSIRLWDLAADNEVGRLPGDHWSLAFSPDGKTVAAGIGKPGVGGMDLNKVNLWDVATRRLVRRLESEPKKGGYEWVAYYRVAFSPDGKLLAAGGRGLLSAGGSTDGVVQLWDLATGKPGRRLTLMDHPDEFGEVQAVAFSPDGKTLAASAFVNLDANNNGCKIRLWEVATGKPLARLSAALNDWPDKEPPQPPWFLMKRPMILPRLTFSPDGKMLALNRLQKTIPVWEAVTGKERLRLAGHQDSTLCVAFAPDGRTLASAGWDNTIRLWDLATGKELRQLTGHRGPAGSLAFAPDGKTLISAGFDTTVVFWDVAAVTQRARTRGAQLPANEWDTLWEDLAGADAAKAHRAITTLSAAPEQAVSFLQERLRPARATDAKRIARLIDGLDSNSFAAREKAARELEALGEIAEPGLRRALRRQSSLEFQRRAEQALDRIAIPSGERLRALRAVEVLEHMATPEAKQVLEALAQGTTEARLTQEAKASLERVTRRSASTP